DDLGVLGRLLDVAQRDPEAVLLDGEDALRGRALPDLLVPEPRVCEREVAALAPDGFRGQAVRQLRDRIDGEQRMIGQLVMHGHGLAGERIRKDRRVDVEDLSRAHAAPLPAWSRIPPGTRRTVRRPQLSPGRA